MAFTIFHENTPRIRGVLFDMDGLVLDSEKLFVRFWAEAAAQFGFSMTYQQALGMRALSGSAGQAQIRSYFGESASYQDIRQKRIELMNAYIEIHGIDLKPGIRELLGYLKSHGIRCAITSSSPRERIRRYLGQHGLADSFDALCSGHDVPNGKPAPDIYLHGAASLGLRSEECLALEDAPAGIESAFRAGCFPVIIPDLDQPNDKTISRCYAKADSLFDVIGILEMQK